MFHTLFWCSFVNFEQADAGWEAEGNVADAAVRVLK